MHLLNTLPQRLDPGATPTFAGLIASTLTSPASTDLTLAGGAGNSSIILTPAGTGNVGIGTTSPGHNLAVYSANGTDMYLGHDNASGTFPKVSALGLGSNAVSYGYANNGGTLTVNGSAQIAAIQSQSSGAETALAFYTTTGGGVGERMRILNSGNVGIGTTSPVSLLELKSAAPVVTLNGTDNTQTKGIDFATNGSVQASIRANIQSGELKISSGTSGYGGFMVFATDTVERIRVAATSGNVSIASTAASSSSLTGALQVAGGIGVAGASYFGGAVTVGGNVGFYNNAPVAKPTGVAVTAAAIHAALVTLNLISA